VYQRHQVCCAGISPKDCVTKSVQHPHHDYRTVAHVGLRTEISAATHQQSRDSWVTSTKHAIPAESVARAIAFAIEQLG